MPVSSDSTSRLATGLALAFVLVLSFFTYFYNAEFPPHVYWDENYHIASAQKYLNGIFFMEQHPPLGKLMIALGEYLIDANPQATTVQGMERRDAEFITTDYATNFAPEFSFRGYRLVPAFLAWMTAGVLFGIFLLISRSALVATLLSFLYVFDNALIVHLRGAMLESTLLFFVATAILFFLLLLRFRERKREFLLCSALFGVSIAGAATTKLFGLILVFFIPPLLLVLYPHWQRIGNFIGVFLLTFLITYMGVWWTHFAIAKTVLLPDGSAEYQLPDGGYYQASPEYRAILAAGRTAALSAFPALLRDSFKYVSHYNAGTPTLNLCKDDENGSPFFVWPVGARSINYRWETPNGHAYQYLYLQANPVVWWSALLAVILSFCFLLTGIFHPVHHRMKGIFLLAVFTGLYVIYMLVIAQIDRVLYLYHYFIPLLFSFILFGILVTDIAEIGPWKWTPSRKVTTLIVWAALVFTSYQFYRPLTYYEPLTDAQVQARSLLPLWDLHCVRCPRTNHLALPLGN